MGITRAVFFVGGENVIWLGEIVSDFKGGLHELSIMPNKAKISLFYRIFKFLTLFGMKFKKSAKTRKNEKTQHLNGCFKSIKQFHINF